MPWSVRYDEEIDNRRQVSWEKCVPTTEDWYPTINGKLRLAIIHHQELARICIWGGDDFGMEKDFDITMTSFEDLLNEAKKIDLPVTVKQLTKLAYN